MPTLRICCVPPSREPGWTLTTAVPPCFPIPSNSHVYGVTIAEYVIVVLRMPVYQDIGIVSRCRDSQLPVRPILPSRTPVTSAARHECRLHHGTEPLRRWVFMTAAEDIDRKKGREPMAPGLSHFCRLI